MKEMLQKMMNKAEDMSPEEASAKMDVLKEMLSMLHGEMGSKLKGNMDEMRKVSVMAPDKESLSEGLDKAKALVGEMPEGGDPIEQAEEMTGQDLDNDQEEGESEGHKERMMEDLGDLSAAKKEEVDMPLRKQEIAQADSAMKEEEKKPKKKKLFSMLDDEE